MYEQHLKQQEHLKDCADYQLHNPWKLKLRRLGKHVRKFMAHLAPGRLRKKRQGYSKFYTEDEERLRYAARQMRSNNDYYSRADRIARIEFACACGAC